MRNIAMGKLTSTKTQVGIRAVVIREVGVTIIIARLRLLGIRMR